MPRVKQGTPPVVADTCVLSSFYHVHADDVLRGAFANPLTVPAQVVTEIKWLEHSGLGYIHRAIQGDISGHRLDKLNIFVASEESSEFLELTTNRRPSLGDGEAAALVWVRYHGGTVLSDNLSDIRDYCDQYSLDFMCTEDVLCKAVENGLLVERANNIWIGMKKTKAKLPDYDFCTALQLYRTNQLH